MFVLFDLREEISTKMETINEKLTIQALKEHDKVHPKLKASSTKDPGTVTSSNKDTKEDEKPRKINTERRLRLTSQSDTVSVKSGGIPKSDGRPSGMSFFRIVAATRAWQRLAKKSKASSSQPQKPIVRLENTYRLEPVSGTAFSPEKVENVIRDVLDSRLNKVTYHPARSKTLATDLSTVIKGRVKMLDFKRYKIVCNVIIMENKDQGVQVASRCIWNSSTDNFATYTYRNSSITAIAYVHGAYYE
ncbi:hypothetical protein KUTeg_010479 [Tegillarca granosa]|uniref:Uncharacterized protein n=1 Tax=Tegillarca granosa TaxID=220873 RepID=A0ABQ9FA53_TEGGR|nr:hypothetical protein KUTeg_010479 [Tegillarca granosa]